MNQTLTDAVPEVLEAPRLLVEAAMAEHMTATDLPENLRDAIEYAVLGGGKRLRPALTLLACEAVGGEREAALAPAVAIELVHCFSLVHDDLPAMDDDDLRRGRPTLHRHAGEAMAILAGDAMLSFAFEVLAADRLLADRHDLRSELVRELSVATRGMIAGQVYDTLGGFASDLSEVDRVRLIHRNKTAALIRASCRMGGMAGGASEADLAALTEFGEDIGLMFQVIDDLLDVTQSTEHLGKATGKDIEAGKLTYPGTLGVDASREEVQRLQDAAGAAIDRLGPSARHLREVCDYLAIRTR